VTLISLVQNRRNDEDALRDKPLRVVLYSRAWKIFVKSALPIVHDVLNIGDIVRIYRVAGLPTNLPVSAKRGGNTNTAPG
jgi:hypothetical protein